MKMRKPLTKSLGRPSAKPSRPKARPAARPASKPVAKGRPALAKGRPAARKKAAVKKAVGGGWGAAAKAAMGGISKSFGKPTKRGTGTSKAKAKRPNLGGPGGYRKGSIGAKRARMAKKK